MSKFQIRHITKYIYETAVRDSASQIMLYPIQDDFQEVQSHTIKITGDPFVEIHNDYYGNAVGTFTHSQPHDELVIDSKLIISSTPKVLPLDDMPVAEQWQALKDLKFQIPFIDFIKTAPFDSYDSVKGLIDEKKPHDMTPLNAAKHFCSYIYDNFQYKKGITTVESTLDEVWSLRSGVCQDFAHTLLVILRLMDIPARYVSGYICPNQVGMRGEGATHAWVEAYIPFYGWLGLDPTNNSIVNENHVRLAVGKSFTDCSPVKGTYRGTSDHTLEVAVAVAYEDGHTSEEKIETLEPAKSTTSSYSQNSFRRHQEQMQQQQQQ